MKFIDFLDEIKKEEHTIHFSSGNSYRYNPQKNKYSPLKNLESSTERIQMLSIKLKSMKLDTKTLCEKLNMRRAVFYMYRGGKILISQKKYEHYMKILEDLENGQS